MPAPNPQPPPDPTAEQRDAARAGLRNATAAAVSAAQVLGDLAAAMEGAVTVPAGEVGELLAATCELFQRLDLTGLSPVALQRWAAISVVVAANASGVAAAAMLGILNPGAEVGALAPAGGDPIPARTERPLIVGADGRSAAGTAPTLVGLDGRPLSTLARG
mgnify:CR=1 FL=1